MDAGQLPSTRGSTRYSARLSVLPCHVQQRIWQQLVPKERKIVQAARREYPTDRAPPEYTLTIRDFNRGPKLPVILHICRESRVLLPLVFLHATLDDKTNGIWWNRDVDGLFLDYDIGPEPARFFSHILCNYTPVRHLAVGLKLGADFIYRLGLQDDLRVIVATPMAKDDLGFLQSPQTLSIVYPSLPKYWTPRYDQRTPLDIEDGLRKAGELALPLNPSYLRGDVENNMVTVYDASGPEMALELLLILKTAQDKLFVNRLFYAILEALIQQKCREYQRIAADASQRWGLRRVERLAYALPSFIRGPNQVMYVTPLMRFDDGPPTAWVDALKAYLARMGESVPAS